MPGNAAGDRAGWWYGWGNHSGAGTTTSPLRSLFSEVLKRRAILLTEATILQQQNSELRRLLEEYISSGVSAVSCSFIHPMLCAPHNAPRHGAIAQNPSLSGSGALSLQLNSKLICPPTQWMDLNLS